MSFVILNAADVLEQLRAIGADVAVRDGRLHVNPGKDQLPDELQTQITAHKQELISLLSPPELPALPRRDGALPLSFFQERLWLLHQFQPQSTAYNLTAVWSSEAAVDVSFMERALAGILQRHETLRAVFRDRDGTPTIELAAEGAPVEVRDLRHLVNEEEAKTLISEDGREQVHKPFDLKRDLPARFVIYRIAGDRLVTRLVAHHIAVDAWSMVLIGHEVNAAFNGRAPLSGTNYTYFDFAHWQRSAHLSSRLDSELAWWEKNLAGAPPTSTLPSPRARRPFAPAETRVYRLGGELSAAVRAMAREERVTPYMVLVAACASVLHSYSGQLDVVLGCPMGARERPEFETIIGPFVSALALRVDLRENPSFAELLARVRSAAINAYAHRDVPFEKLVEHLNPERSLDRTPLFQVAIVLQNAPAPDRIDSGGALFDLTYFLREVDGEFVCAIEYRCDAYDGPMIDRAAARFESVLQAAVRNRGARLSEFTRFGESEAGSLSAEERRQLIARARATFRGTPPTTPVVTLFEAQVRRTPDAVAVADAAGALSYQALDHEATSLAQRLRAAGVVAGTRVAIGLERSRAVVVAVLAVLKLRAAYVPLDPQYPADRLAYLFQDCEPAALITDATARTRLPIPAQLPVVDIAAHEDGNLATPVEFDPPQPDDVAYVMYTSGSTGRPKGVEIQHKALSNFLVAMQQRPGLDAGDRVLSVTTISFDISGLEMFLPLVTGASVFIVARELLTDGQRLARLCEQSDATLLQATPATFRMLIEAGWRGSAKLKILCGGEAMPRELANQLIERSGSAWNMYGPTETTIYSTGYQLTPGEGPVPIGTAVANTSVYVLDPHGNLVGEHEVGEIFIGGAGVARGYFKRPDLTAARFLADPFVSGERIYRTGDAGRMRADGTIEYFGRLDDQVKIRGHRVELGEIESVLREHPGISAAVVAAREVRTGDLQLVAYYVPRGATAPHRELRELCRAKLPKEMVPAAWVPITAIPLTPSGKTDRKALPVPTDTSPPEAVRIPPRNALESEITKIWESVLGIPVPSVTDRFFDLGGHSLLVVRLFARIENSLGVALPLAVILESPTIEKLAVTIREAQRPPAASRAIERPFVHLVPIRADGSRAPLFCVHGAGGHVLNMYDLARYLPHHRPFYGLQAAGVDGITRPKATIEAMAEAYLAELRIVQPKGPYYLSGYCGGGLVAYEMAQRLRASGETVALLMLIELHRPGVTSIDSVTGWKRVLTQEGLRKLAWRLRKKITRKVTYLARSLAVRYHLSRGGSMPYELRDFWLTRSFMRSAEQYKLQPYHGKLTVIRAREIDQVFAKVISDLGWSSMAPGGLETYAVPGDHLTLTREPNVRVLAEQVEACARAADDQQTLAALSARAEPALN